MIITEKNKHKIIDGFKVLKTCLTFSKNEKVLNLKDFNEMIKFIQELEKLIFDLIDSQNC